MRKFAVTKGGGENFSEEILGLRTQSAVISRIVKVEEPVRFFTSLLFLSGTVVSPQNHLNFAPLLESLVPCKDADKPVALDKGI